MEKGLCREGEIALQFAVCERNSTYAKHIIAILEKIQNSTGVWYPSGSSLVRALESGAQFDLLLLDMEMPDVSPGIAIRTVRRCLPEIAVAVTATDPRLVTEAFMLDGVEQFFVKPLASTEVFLREICRILANRTKRQAPWCLSVQNCLYRINPQDIICIEGYYGHLTVYAGDQAFELPGRLSAVAQKLKGQGFYLCHQRYLVNLRFVQAIRGTKLICQDGRQILISHRKRAGLLRAYADFKMC